MDRPPRSAVQAWIFVLLILCVGSLAMHLAGESLGPSAISVAAEMVEHGNDFDSSLHGLALPYLSELFLADSLLRMVPVLLVSIPFFTFPPLLPPPIDSQS